MAKATRGTCQIQLIRPGHGCTKMAVARQTGNDLEYELCDDHMYIIGMDSKKMKRARRADRKRYEPAVKVRRRTVRISNEHEYTVQLDMKDETIKRLRDRIEHLEQQTQSRKRGTATDGTIYFLRISGYIKIGWTSDLERRMKAYPPDTMLLATQPGTRSDEAALHKKFAHLRTHGREWYPLAPQLMEYIKRVEHEHGTPDHVDFMAKPAIVPMPHRINKLGPTPKHWSGRAS